MSSSAPTDVLNIDMSSISAFSMCKRRGIMTGHHCLVGKGGKSEYLQAGRAAHTVVEEVMKGNDADHALKLFDKEYKEWSDKNLWEDNPRRHSNLRLILEKWCDNYHTHPYKIPGPEFVECGFSQRLTPWLRIVGKPDALALVDGAWWVIDTKTTGKWDWKFENKWDDSGQMSCYMYCLGEHLKLLGDKRPVVGAIINAIEIKNIPDSTTKCRDKPPHLDGDGERATYETCGIHHVKQGLLRTQRTRQQLEDWRDAVIDDGWNYLKARKKYPNLSDLPNVPATGRINDACGLCRYNDWCNSGKRPELLSLMYETDRWEPFEGAMWPTTPHSDSNSKSESKSGGSVKSADGAIPISV